MVVSLLRTVLLYIIIIIALRIMGKRQIGEMEPNELVVTILISELASIPMQDLGRPLIGGIIPIVTLVCVEILFSGIFLKWRWFQRMFEGSPSIIIANGVINEKELTKNRLTALELLEDLRLQGVTDPSSVHYALLETNGKMSVLQYEAQKPAPAMAARVTVEEAGLPRVLVNDGHINGLNLKRFGLDDKWLQAELRSRGAKSEKEVFLLMRDELGRIYYIPKVNK